MFERVALAVILGVLVIDGFIWLAMLGNISKICDLLEKKEDK